MPFSIKKIYLATPYTHPDINVRIKRFNSVNKKAAELMKRGYCVFSPISMTHPIAVGKDLPGDWEFWERQDMPFIIWCDEFHIFCLDGWKESVGVNAELKLARSLKKRIVYHDEKA